MSISDISLSVVIVTFNSERQITKCLDRLALASQDFATSIDVVDNGSSDGTLARVELKRRALTSARLALKVTHLDQNVGFTRAMNIGLRRAGGKYILWLNPDVYLFRESLTKLVRRLRSGEKTGCVAPQLLNPDGSMQPSCRRFPRHRDVFFEALGLSRLFPRSSFFAGWKMADFRHDVRREVDQPQGACLLFKKEAVHGVGSLDERFEMFFSDVDYCRRLREAGWSVLFEPEARAVHEKGASVYRYRTGMIEASHSDLVRYFRKWYPGQGWVLANTSVALFLGLVKPVRLMLARFSARR